MEAPSWITLVPEVSMLNRRNDQPLNTTSSFEPNRLESATQEKAYLKALPASQKWETMPPEAQEALILMEALKSKGG